MSTLWSLVINESVYSFTSQGVYLRAWQGAGVPPIRNLTSEYGLLPGAFYERAQVAPRTLILEGRAIGSSLSNLHAVRSTLLRRLTPGALVTLRYTGASTTVEIDGYYEAGLELGELAGFSDKLMLRFLCPDPFFRGITTNTSTLAVQSTVNNPNRIMRRDNTTGAWSTMGSGLDSVIHTLARHPVTGAIYAGGDFTGNVAVFNGTSWVAVGSIGGVVRKLLFGPGSVLYAVGDFTGNVAVFNGTSWATVGAGLGWTNARDATWWGALLAVGGEVSGSGRVSYCDIATGAWTALTNLNNTVESVAALPDGRLVAGGHFSGVIVASTGGAWTALAGGASGGPVKRMAVGPDGRLVIVGGITQVGGGLTVNRAALFDGANWQRMGVEPFASEVTAVYAADNGANHVVDHLQIWNGSSWRPLPITLPGGVFASALLSNDEDNQLLIAWSNSGSSVVPGMTSVNNTGSADARPVVTITADGALYELTNYTTGDTIAFNLTLIDDETLTIDLEARTVVSNWRGNMLGAIRPGSNLANWRLQPGVNNVGLYCADATAVATISYKNRYLSVDG